MSKTEKKTRGPIWKEPPFLTGLVITLFVFGVATWSLSAGEVCNAFGSCVSKWEALQTSRPNEIGDSLAGFAGTLAFVWLIVTVWLQATELREQREEFEKMADAQQKQVKLLVKQGEIFEQEQRERLMSVVDEELVELLNSVSDGFDSENIRNAEWMGPLRQADEPHYGNVSWSIIGHYWEEEDPVKLAREKIHDCLISYERILEALEAQSVQKLPARPDELVELSKQCDRVAALFLQASPAMQVRIQRSELVPFASRLAEIVRNPDVWHGVKSP